MFHEVALFAASAIWQSLSYSRKAGLVVKVCHLKSINVVAKLAWLVSLDLEVLLVVERQSVLLFNISLSFVVNP